MRATISFEADVDQVNLLMGALAKQEAERLREVAHILSTAQEHQIGEKLSTGLEMVQKVAHQLTQYKDMLMDFERARFSTLLPQEINSEQPQVSTVREAQETMESMRQFGNFIESINDQEKKDDNPATEG